MKLLIAILFTLGAISFGYRRALETKRARKIENQSNGNEVVADENFFTTGEFITNVILNTVVVYIVAGLSLGATYLIVMFADWILDAVRFFIEAIFWQLD